MKADSIFHEARAGCLVCDRPGIIRWDKRNAVAVAARHHRATGHETWAEQTFHAHWGNPVGLVQDQLPFP